jgi:hypothetical protein
MEIEQKIERITGTFFSIICLFFPNIKNNAKHSNPGNGHGWGSHSDKTGFVGP